MLQGSSVHHCESNEKEAHENPLDGCEVEADLAQPWIQEGVK